jgi:hypothetical protein
MMTKQDKGDHTYTISEVTETNTESNGTFTKDSHITYTTVKREAGTEQ